MKKIFFFLTGVLFIFLVLGCTIVMEKPSKTPKSNNANLKSLTVSTGSLSPAFDETRIIYSVTVPYETTSLTITGKTADPKASMNPENGVVTLNALKVGVAQTATITVTSKDGTTTKEYKVKVTRCEEIKMVHVRAGSFQRDSNQDNISVITKPYWLGKYPITRKQFKAIMGEDPSNETYSSGMNDPVQRVNWYHAIAFCNKLSLLEDLSPAYTVSGVSDWAALAFSSIPTTSNATWNAAICDWESSGYRLPTEMEWMWAAMGADQDALDGPIDAYGINRRGYTKAYAGQSHVYASYIDNHAWYNLNSYSNTHPVGKKRPNELGLYDMSGNVYEWCWDWWDSYPTGTQADYKGIDFELSSNDVVPPSRVLRGGSWFNDASCCTVAYRNYYVPYGQGDLGGFRVLRPVL